MSDPKKKEKTSFLDRETLQACIHCGLCLPACPTYVSSGKETESPRGRIYLVDKLVKGELPLTDRMSSHLESCLGCLGCQTACPSGVNYERIIDSVRPKMAERKKGLSRSIIRLVFKELLPRYSLLRLGGVLTGLWQKAFGRDFLSRLLGSPDTVPVLSESKPRALLRKLSQWEKFMPEVKPHVPLPAKVTPKTASESGIHALLFSGCVMDVFYNHVNHATIKLLLKQGHSVEVPDQTCCGALAFHQGEEDIARELAKKNIEKFGFGQDPIVVTAAGCGAMLKNYKHLFESDHKAKEFSDRVKDLSEILAEHSFDHPPEKLKSNTTYHAACHLAHAQNVRAAPLELLKELESDDGPSLIPLKDSEHCCGSAGIYNLFNTEMALSVLDRKLDHIEETGARVVVTSNPGCQLQIEAGLKERGLDVKVKHIAEILDDSY